MQVLFCFAKALSLDAISENLTFGKRTNFRASARARFGNLYPS